MLNLQVDPWTHLHGGALFNATIKTQLSDFKVFETLSFEPNSSGEHTLIHIEKTGLNTAFVAEALAKFGKLPLRNVSYAGRKDKYAITSQWFGIYHGGKAKTDWLTFEMPGVRIIETVQNERKLRTGAIKSNKFEIVMRDIDTLDQAALLSRIEAIKVRGVPNYYGNQRFGELIKSDGSVILGGNLQLAEKLVNGEEIRNRNKRSMAISALRSWLFNHFVSNRISQLAYQALLDGDALSLSGSNSFFIHAQNDEALLAATTDRLKRGDVLVTAPLWGEGELDSQGQARTFEQSAADEYSQVCDTLVRLQLSQQRRPVLLFVEDFSVQISDNSAVLSFSLPSGCFATSVLREIANVKVGSHAHVITS
ncbi:tRNA pseudouridine13 synthase [Glaciecola punicea ACAM 611]|jgi:tRNA pseudouridine13 synthase|uniref:tRNA pseudouridine synthase D n=1 Tax=Glaciecola punicea ACAM 611 TaxID=1121923 RepID=H5TEK8_9ALTE|nr:tRNA pseudouridine(13) synthase TruD [Glaciecola punicea]OFA32293.1 tRNA pseudouridine(13) synthase TruD [Glaciecola punicea]GAB56735.1 tRNA pseudouridine13 synthase [Glaciecola punicea ACAM 611]